MRRLVLLCALIALLAVNAALAAEKGRIPEESLKTSILRYLGDDYGKPQIVVRKNEKADISVRLVYPKGQPETDPASAGMLCAAGIAAALEEHSVNPKKEWLYFSCWVESEDGPAADTQKTSRVFGSAVFDFNSGDIAWKPFKP